MKYAHTLMVLVVLVSMTGAGIFLSRTPKSFASVIDSCIEQKERKEQCFAEQIVSVGTEDGIGRGFDLLAEIYALDQEFAEFCHGNTHDLGEIAYHKFVQTGNVSLSEKTSFCGFGFYHGFMEALLAESGELAEAQRFCEYADSELSGQVSGIPYACYHGIGHGVVDGSDPRRWGDMQSFIEPGLTLCAKFTDNEEHRERCASGVFNSLAVAFYNPKYRLPFDPADVYAICRVQKESYERESCHDQMNSYVVPKTRDIRAALAVAINSASDEFRKTAVVSVAAFSAKTALSEGRDPADDMRVCTELSQYAHECVQGYATGLIEFGLPDREFDIPLEVCPRMGTFSADCYRGLANAARDRATPKSQKNVCQAIENSGGAAAGAECRLIVGAP